MNKFKTWADENLQGDRVIWAVVFALSLISILVVYSSIGTLAFKRTESPESFLIKHTFTVLIGLGSDVVCPSGRLPILLKAFKICFMDQHPFVDLYFY
jgi:cell division protein FtsW (lipid II flippase)